VGRKSQEPARAAYNVITMVSDFAPPHRGIHRIKFKLSKRDTEENPAAHRR
jgi:hypothetical protein